VAAFSTSPDSSATVFTAGSLGGFGTSITGEKARRNETLAHDEQKQWFAREVLPHETGLRRWLWRHHPTLKADLDDLVQESYLRLWRAHAAGPIHCARTYLFGIARYVALEMHRRGRQCGGTCVNEFPEGDTIAGDDDVVAMVNHNQELALTAEAIKQLPDRCRQIVILHATEGVSYHEIAQRLGLAEETVRVQMARGIKKCIDYLRERSAFERDSL
jgi:RNA polymerase sigma factor (sigma-70 family)